MARDRGNPLIINGEKIDTIKRINLFGDEYNEKFLQELIYRNPEIIPIDDIEPSFGRLISVSMEIPCGHGFIDNLFITIDGDIVLAETKLWRNPEMRRQVVAQTLDYVAALSRMEYETFQRNISRGFNGPKRLYDLVSDNSNSLTESQFIDAVSRNIKKSKILVIVIGDGIKEEASILASLLQNNMHSYFTFSLVELWMGRSNNNGILVFPSVFTKTMIIERNIININGEGYSVEPLKKNLDRPVPYSIGFSDFMYSLRKLNDKLPENIEFFISTLNEIGIYTEIKKSSLSILVELEENLIICFGYITTKGEFWTDRGPSSALKPAWRTYIETISNIIGGKIRDNLQGKIECLDERGKVPLISKFVPDNTQALISAMQRLMQDLSKDV